MSSQMDILTNVIDKLDNLQIDFNISDLDVIPALKDTTREMGIISLEGVLEGSDTELYIELRTEYWMLHRFRNSQTLNFKYSTSIDGRTIDKTMIPKLISETMMELDTQFKWFINTKFNKSSSGTWTKVPRESSRLK